MATKKAGGTTKNGRDSADVDWVLKDMVNNWLNQEI